MCGTGGYVKDIYRYPIFYSRTNTFSKELSNSVLNLICFKEIPEYILK